MLTIEPEQTVYFVEDSPPRFSVRSDADATFAFELANNAILFNGSLFMRRSERNFYRGPVRELAAGERLIEAIPSAIWVRLRIFGVLFFRVVAAAVPPPLGRAIDASTTDFNYEASPLLAVAEPLGTIRVNVGVI